MERKTAGNAAGHKKAVVSVSCEKEKFGHLYYTLKVGARCTTVKLSQTVLKLFYKKWPSRFFTNKTNRLPKI